jgi:3-methyladenine DNA glycosylase AlkD
MLNIIEAMNFLNCDKAYAEQIIDTIDSWDLVDWSRDSTKKIQKQMLLAQDILTRGEDAVFGI